MQGLAPSRMNESTLEWSRMPENRALRGLGAIPTPYAGELPYLTSQGLVEPAGSFGGFGGGLPTSQGEVDSRNAHPEGAKQSAEAEAYGNDIPQIGTCVIFRRHAFDHYLAFMLRVRRSRPTK